MWFYIDLKNNNVFQFSYTRDLFWVMVTCFRVIYLYYIYIVLRVTLQAFSKAFMCLNKFETKLHVILFYIQHCWFYFNVFLCKLWKNWKKTHYWQFVTEKSLLRIMDDIESKYVLILCKINYLFYTIKKQESYKKNIDIGWLISNTMNIKIFLY